MLFSISQPPILGGLIGVWGQVDEAHQVYIQYPGFQSRTGTLPLDIVRIS